MYDFQAPERPRVIELPAGMAVRLERDMARAIAELRIAMRASFESDQYRARKHELFDQMKKRQEREFQDVQSRARQRDVGVVQTDAGMAITALYDGESIEPDKFNALPEEQKKKLQAALEVTSGELREMFAKFHDWGREHRESLKSLDRETAAAVACRTMDTVRGKYTEIPALLEHLSKRSRAVG